MGVYSSTAILANQYLDLKINFVIQEIGITLTNCENSLFCLSMYT